MESPRASTLALLQFLGHQPTVQVRQASSSHNQSSLVLVSDLSNQKLKSKQGDGYTVELECGRRVGVGEAKILAMIAIFLCITLLHLPTNRSPMVRYPHLPLHHTDAYLDALAHFVDFILMQSHNRPDAKPFGVKTLPLCIFGCGLLFSLQLSDP